MLQEQGQSKRSAPTIAENIQAKARTLNNWHRLNPGLSDETDYESKRPKTYVLKEILESDAYRSLSKSAMLIYQDFLAKRKFTEIGRGKTKRWELINNGEIVYPFSEAESKGFSRQTYNRSLVELQNKGFIDITHRGKGGRPPAKGTGDMTKFLIDDRWRSYDPETGESLRPPRMPKAKDTRQDRGFALLMNDPKKKKAILKKRRSKNRKSQCYESHSLKDY
jgi:hypothetical protein